MNLLKNGLILGGLTGLSLLSAPVAKGELIGYWPLNETAGLTATNMAHGGTLGILTNGAAWVTDAQRGAVISGLSLLPPNLSTPQQPSIWTTLTSR